MEKTIAYQMTDNSRHMRRLFDDRVRDMDLTGPQARLMLSFARHPGKNQAFFADRFDIEPITLTRTIDRLERAGHIERRPDPSDRRARLLFLTDKGQSLLAPLEETVTHMLDDVLRGLDAGERQTLAMLLDRIADNLAKSNSPEAVHG